MSELPNLHILISYAEKNPQLRIDTLREACSGKVNVRIFLDSGAFSVMTTGKKIKLSPYIQFIYDNIDSIDAYAALDVIGDPWKTEDNLNAMRSSGLDPVAVDHFGSSMDTWRHICHNHGYVAIGGAARSGMTTHRLFSKMRFVEALKINPEIKIHGFGITNPTSIMNLPYYSVDSTSWLTGRFGDLRLWHPELNTILTWARPNSSVLAHNIDVMRKLLACYDRGIDDYLNRVNMRSYDISAMKSFIQMENYIRDNKPQATRIYLASAVPYLFKKEGVLEYLFSPLLPYKGSIGSPKSPARKQAANFKKIKEKRDKAEAKKRKQEERKNNAESKSKRGSTKSLLEYILYTDREDQGE